MLFATEAKQYTDPEKMAADYLVKYYRNQKIEYPINPFQILSEPEDRIPYKSVSNVKG